MNPIFQVALTLIGVHALHVWQTSKTNRRPSLRRRTARHYVPRDLAVAEVASEVGIALVNAIREAVAEPEASLYYAAPADDEDSPYYTVEQTDHLIRAQVWENENLYAYQGEPA